MSIKEDLIEAVRERLKLTTECGFPAEDIDFIVEQIERIPEENFLDTERTNSAINHGVHHIGTEPPLAYYFDCINPTREAYYRKLCNHPDKNSLPKRQKADLFAFSQNQSSMNWNLDWRTINVLEARIPLWEYHETQLIDNPGPVEIHPMFCAHADLAYRYRQLLHNPYWEDEGYMFMKFYREHMDLDKMEELLDRVTGWFIEQSVGDLEGLSEYFSDDRIIALSFYREDQPEVGERFLQRAFERAKSQKNYLHQERLIVDMDEAGVAVPFKDRVKVKLFV